MSYLPEKFKPPLSDPPSAKPSGPLHSVDAPDPTLVSSTASHQHQQEQEMLLGFTVPEPPMSTKELTLAATGSDPDDLLPAESPRTLWMGDLDPWLNEHAIVDLWWKILGMDVSVKLIKPRAVKSVDHPQQTHSGYCFVEFTSFENAQRALSLNGQLLPDIAMPSQQHFRNNPHNQKKYFRLNWALGATLTAPIVESPEYSLFVGDLSASTTEAHLLSFFQKSFPNSVRTVRVMTDPISGKSRCFGFVRFTNEEDRQQALVEMNGAWFGGRPLRVALATPKSGSLLRKPSDFKGMMHPTSPVPHPMYLSGAPHTPLPGYYPSPIMNDMGFDMKGSSYPMPMGDQQFLDPNNTTVFVGGLLPEVSEKTLFTLFLPFGTIQQIKIPPGKNCGFLKYTAREEAEEAILAMEGFIINGHRVRLGWGRVSSNNRKFQRHHMAQLQMQAVAAMSMGMDPSSIYAAVGYGPNSSGAPPSAHGYPPMPVGMPPHGMMPYLNYPPEEGQMFDQSGESMSYYQTNDPELSADYSVSSMEGSTSMLSSGVNAYPEELTTSFGHLDLGLRRNVTSESAKEYSEEQKAPVQKGHDSLKKKTDGSDLGDSEAMKILAGQSNSLSSEKEK